MEYDNLYTSWDEESLSGELESQYGIPAKHFMGKKEMAYADRHVPLGILYNNQLSIISYIHRSIKLSNNIIALFRLLVFSCGSWLIVMYHLSNRGENPSWYIVAQCAVLKAYHSLILVCTMTI